MCGLSFFMTSSYADNIAVNSIEFSGNYTLRNEPDFRSSNTPDNYITHPAKAEVLEYQNSLKYGAGIKVRLTAPPAQVGKEGWIYYSFNRKAYLKFLDKNGNELKPNQQGKRNFFRNQEAIAQGLVEEDTNTSPSSEDQEETNTYSATPFIQNGNLKIPIPLITKQHLQNSQRLILDKPTPAFYQPENSDHLQTVTLQPGYYIIDQNKLNAQGIIPLRHKIKLTKTLPDGTTQTIIKPATFMITKYGLNFDPQSVDYFTRAPSGGVCHDCNEDQEPTAGLIQEDGIEWHPGCEVLQFSRQDSDLQKLEECTQNIFSAIKEKTGTNYNRRKLLKALYSELNPKEQDFIALILTSLGEVSDSQLSSRLLQRYPKRAENEKMMVMKVIENRARYARDKENNDKINNLDIALQPWQFSMYNSNDNNLHRAIFDSPKETITRTIKAFIKLKSNPPPKITGTQSKNSRPINPDRIYHYHSSILNNRVLTTPPPGRQDIPYYNIARNRPSSINIDNEPMLTNRKIRHIFYQDVRWSYKPNPFQPEDRE